MKNSSEFKIFGELNYFISKKRKDISFNYDFDDNPSIKDSIEAIGVPHVEVGKIIVNNEEIDFNYKLQNNDKVEVYSFYENAIISKLRPEIELYKFMTDENVGGMAKYLRMLGLNTIMIPEISDKEVARIAEKENRILLSRDFGLLKRKNVTHGLFLRSTNTEEQIYEAIKKFKLEKLLKPFSICIECNGEIKVITSEQLLKEDKVEDGVLKDYNEFFRCANCKKVFWKGSHYQRMRLLVDKYIKINDRL
ncbi:MAG: Mut7-C RNAse domain-containing protein [Candidatus Sericytochromatia bacterium]